MNALHLPDRYPGRCLNHRVVFQHTEPTTVRCLEAEGVEHTCRFPKPLRIGQASQWSQTRYDLPKPEPWVVPPVPEASPVPTD